MKDASLVVVLLLANGASSEEAGLLGGGVAPLLDHRLGHLARVRLGLVADLLGHVDALLGGFQVRDQAWVL